MQYMRVCLVVIYDLAKYDSNSYSGAYIKDNGVYSLTRILLIEDNPINVKIAMHFLEHIGIKNIDQALSGREALELCKKNNYSLILSDIGLPDIDGIEICKTLKQMPSIKSVPIIAITAYADLKIKCLQAGFDDFISKPMDLNILKGVIEKWVENN